MVAPGGDRLMSTFQEGGSGGTWRFGQNDGAKVWNMAARYVVASVFWKVGRLSGCMRSQLPSIWVRK